MMIRQPVVAGQFYPAQAVTCRQDLEKLLRENRPDPMDDPRLAEGRVIGGLVPHAGWMCSGATSAKVFHTLASPAVTKAPSVIVLFGGVHRYRGREAALFTNGEWETPLGPLTVDARLAERVMGYTNLIADDPYAHEDEHSLEVQAPFIKYLFPEAMILPLMVPITNRAAEVGQAVGRTLQSYRYHALIVGTTDLTHYGPRYGFIPKGIGAEGNAWAKNDNDRRFIDLLCDMKTESLVQEAKEHRNACNSGAAAATLAAAAVLGATTGILLSHTTSAEVLADQLPGEQADSVGYAGIVFVQGDFGKV